MFNWKSTDWNVTVAESEDTTKTPFALSERLSIAVTDLVTEEAAYGCIVAYCVNVVEVDSLTSFTPLSIYTMNERPDVYRCAYAVLIFIIHPDPL